MLFFFFLTAESREEVKFRYALYCLIYSSSRTRLGQAKNARLPHATELCSSVVMTSQCKCNTGPGIKTSVILSRTVAVLFRIIVREPGKDDGDSDGNGNGKKAKKIHFI